MKKITKEFNCNAVVYKRDLYEGKILDDDELIIESTDGDYVMVYSQLDVENYTAMLEAFHKSHEETLQHAFVDEIYEDYIGDLCPKFYQRTVLLGKELQEKEKVLEFEFEYLHEYEFLSNGKKMYLLVNSDESNVEGGSKKNTFVLDDGKAAKSKSGSDLVIFAGLEVYDLGGESNEV